jgi:hypothetical protein
MTTTQINQAPAGGWTEGDRVAPKATPRILHAETAITVRLTPISGNPRLYRLTRVVENGPFWTFAGIRVNKAGKVVGAGHVMFIADVAGRIFGGLGGGLEVVA